MAGDWIKMRTDLYRDPKVCVMADSLMEADSELSRFVNQNCQRNMSVTRNVTRNATVGALVSVWGVLRLRGKRINDDLVVPSVTVSIIDDVADLPGFGEAMIKAGWAIQNAKGIVFPNFFGEFNTDPNEKANSKNAERQRRYREKQANLAVTEDVTKTVTRNVTRNVTVTHREEKSREESTKDSKDICGPLREPAATEPATEPIPTATKPLKPDPENGNQIKTAIETRSLAETGKEPSQPEKTPPRPRNPVWDAIVEVTAAEVSTNAGQIGKLIKQLSKANPPYHPAEILEFGERFHELCPWAADDGRDRPTIGELGKHIGAVRATPAKVRPVAPRLGRLRTVEELAIHHAHSLFNGEQISINLGSEETCQPRITGPGQQLPRITTGMPPN